MKKEMLKREIENGNLSLQRQVERKGGLDALTDKDAENLCRRFHLHAISVEESAFVKYMSLYEQGMDIALKRGELGEASSVWEAIECDDELHSDLYAIYTRQIAEIKAEMETLRESAQKHADFTNYNIQSGTTKLPELVR